MQTKLSWIVGPTVAFLATALIIRFESRECNSCKLPPRTDHVETGKKIDFKYSVGNKGALLVVVGECRSCAMKHVDREFLSKCMRAGFDVTFIESIFNKTSAEPQKTSFEGIPVISVGWIPFHDLTTSFLPRLILVDKDKRVLVRQQKLDEVLNVPG